ncbi:MAG: mechanosensitive ion channel [Bacteroidetes bacterium]|nr:MAG: mechanosensitive ion channel [Bacteroidota bacterium]
MMSYALFKLGPYEVCIWNLIVIALIFLLATVLRRIIHRSLKRALIGANIRMEGTRATWLKLLSQSVYIVAVYLAVLSFRINNEGVSVREFLEVNLVELSSFKLGFYHVFIIGLLIVGARMLVNFSKLYFSRKFRGKVGYNPSTEYVYVQLSKYVIYVFCFLFILKSLDINLTNLFIGSAALLVGVGLGLQDVFKDMVSGLILLFEGTVKIGDVIELQDSSFPEPIIAKIIKIDVRTTQIETRDGNVLIIPNARLTQEYVENWSHQDPLTRFIINVSVAYGSDTELVKNLMRQAALSHPKVKKSRQVHVRLKNFGDNGLELELIFWADQSWEANFYKSDIRFEIDRLFREYNITIPFPQRTISYGKGAEEKKAP